MSKTGLAVGYPCQVTSDQNLLHVGMVGVMHGNSVGSKRIHFSHTQHALMVTVSHEEIAGKLTGQNEKQFVINDVVSV